jgi:excisionase family DNA binding protein
MSVDDTIQKTAQQAAERAVERAMAERLAFVEQEYLTTAQAAQYLGLSKQHLEICRHQRIGPKYLKMPNRVRYRKADLDAWMEQFAQGTDTLQGADSKQGEAA